MYLRQLHTMQREVAPSVDEAVVHDCGTASFLFVKRHGRAVEVSEHEDGGWWLEFWEASEDEDAPPVRETTVRTEKEAIGLVMRWLSEA
jgi:hypothetical protein